MSSPTTGFGSLEDQVMSEVHIGCPPHYSAPHISHFTFALPSEHGVEGHKYVNPFDETSSSTEQIIIMDEDGDLIVARKSNRSVAAGGVTIQHNILSTIAGVGCQIWRAELILADFVLHKMFTSSEFNEIIAVELGAGTGLVGILLARVARTVYITDRGQDVLDNCAKNVELNSGAFRNISSVHVRELDWQSSWPPCFDTNKGSPEGRSSLRTLPSIGIYGGIVSGYSWTSPEVEDVNRASILLAADVIYSDDLTDAFFSILEKLMSQGSEKVLYLALEKRYNFSLSDLDVVANGYSHFRSYFRDKEYEGPKDRTSPKFVGRLIDLSSIPQYIKEYDRGDDVELWRISYDSNSS